MHRHAHARAHACTVCTQKGLSFPLSAELLCGSKLESNLSGKRMAVLSALVLFVSPWAPGARRGPSSIWIKGGIWQVFTPPFSFLV